MTLKRSVAALADVEEALRSLYVERDGQFFLDVEGDDPKASATLEKERKARAAAESALKNLKSQLGDLDPAKAREALKTIAELEEKNLLGEGKFEEAVAKRVERMKTDYEEKIKTLTGESGKLSSRLEELLIDNAIRTVATKAGVLPTAIDDAVLFGRTVWRLKEGQPVPMRGEEVLYGKEPNKPMTMEEWVSERAKDRAHWFAPSSGGGAQGSSPSGRAGGAITLTREQAKDRSQYLAAKEQADKTGAQLVIQ